MRVPAGPCTVLLTAAALSAAAHADEPAPPAGPTPVVPTAPAPASALDEVISCFGLEVPRLRGEDCGVKWRVGAYAAFDAAFYDSSNERDDDFGATDLRPVIEASSGPFSLRIEGDAVGVDTPRNLYEAWAAWEFSPAVRLSAGQFRVALGSEFATWERDLSFVGYAFPAQLDGRHDLGARIDGNPTEGLWYQAAWTAGHGFDLEGHRLNSSQISVRGVAHPARLAAARADSPLRGLHVGLAYAVLDDFDDPVIVSNPLQSRIFATPDLGGDGGDWFHIDVGWTWGPVQFAYEQVMGTADDVPTLAGGKDEYDDLTAFSWSAFWNLTGEPRGWADGGFRPKTGPRPPDGPFSFLPAGRWELGGRYSNADIDRKLFLDGHTTYAVSSQETRTFSTALFWEPCDTLRIGVEWVKTIADDGIAAFGGEKRDDSFVLRLEFRF